MPMRLEITFTGLFLFVPDQTTNSLHVILPATGFGPVHPHTATIHKQGSASSKTFGNEDLILVGKGSGTVLKPPAECVQLRQITGRALERVQIRPGKRDNIHASITLPPASTMLPGAMSALFDVPVLGPKPMTHCIQWSASNFNQPAAVFKRTQHTGPAPVPTEFEIKPDDDVIRVCIQHLPEHPEVPTHPFEARHFQAYYRVYKPPLIFSQNPHLITPPAHEPRHPCLPSMSSITEKFERLEEKLEEAMGEEFDDSDSTFTCMVAQVEPV